VKTLVSIPNEVPWTEMIMSAMPSDSGNEVIFSEVYSTLPNYRHAIYIMDIDSEITIRKKIIEGGFNASLSPDEKKIAYVGDEGIYVANVDGSHQTLLVPIDFDFVVNIYPQPFWSPDGTTLVYHKCTNTACYDLSDFSIYQVNVNTGVEKKIIAGGLFPIWIK
jgi:Tol biopolymer transport system component